MKTAWWIIGLIAAGVIYYHLDPGSGLMPPCPFYLLTDLYCPGCGSQRALHALVHGDAAGAFRANPLLPVALGFALIEGLIYMLQQIGFSLPMVSARRSTPMIVLGIILLFWILRNIPMLPFTYLAPHS